jgi:16S rRNA (cytosine967-C5)-methyltransferase
MRDDARLQAAIELLEQITGSARPADGTAAAFFRERRFIGSKDRRAISMRVYGVMRHWARLAWWFREAAADTWARGDRPDWNTIRPRARLITHLVQVEGMGTAGIEGLCTGELYAPRPLNEHEKAIIRWLKNKPLNHDAMPTWVRGEVPEWVVPRLEELYGEALPDMLTALNTEAPVDLRVNSLKCDQDNAIIALAEGEEPVEAVPGSLSPLALRLNGRVNLAATPAFRGGLVEVQDEGSQLVALLADAQPGMAVVDFCAGAGGKTLALAAQMQNKGRLVACDVSQGRVDRAAERLKRAGAHNVSRRVLSSEADKWVKRSKGTFDRVLIDAPCSGTGTWRRNPDAKWRFTPDTLADLTDLQGRILRSASRLAKPGGLVIYATCSVLPDENEAQVEAFIEASNGTFTLVPVPEVWPQLIPSIPCPVSGPYLRLAPHTHQTDGFFAAILRRVPKEDQAAD